MSHSHTSTDRKDFGDLYNQVLSSPEHKFHIRFTDLEAAAHVLSDAEVRQYLRKYFYISNDISLDKEWGELFTEDGVYIMGNRKATGREAIRTLRKKLYEEIPQRDHSPVKIFSHGNHHDDTEMMILGTVGWTYHEGHSHAGDWAAHVKLHKGEDGVLRCKYYQIIAVSAVLHVVWWRGSLDRERGADVVVM
ncbi:MAG: hypothetical protein Q9213_007084 [Squamulea squamosa]